MPGGTLRLDLNAPQLGWDVAAPTPAGPLILPATATSCGMLYVFGGMSRTDAGELADTALVARYDPQRNRWLPAAPLPSPRRGATAVVLDDRYIAIIGGCQTRERLPVMLDDVLGYDTVEDRYYALAKLPYAAMCVSAVVHGGRVYVCGGEDKPRSRVARTVVGTLRMSSGVGSVTSPTPTTAITGQQR
jgi:N-acetylneuraminic acid mutarotase